MNRLRVKAPLGCAQTEYDIVRHQEATFQAAEDKMRQIQKSLNKFELSRTLSSAAWKIPKAALRPREILPAKWKS